MSRGRAAWRRLGLTFAKQSPQAAAAQAVLAQRGAPPHPEKGANELRDALRKHTMTIAQNMCCGCRLRLQIWVAERPRMCGAVLRCCIQKLICLLPEGCCGSAAAAPSCSGLSQRSLCLCSGAGRRCRRCWWQLRLRLSLSCVFGSLGGAAGVSRLLSLGSFGRPSCRSLLGPVLLLGLLVLGSLLPACRNNGVHPEMERVGLKPFRSSIAVATQREKKSHQGQAPGKNASGTRKACSMCETHWCCKRFWSCGFAVCACCPSGGCIIQPLPLSFPSARRSDFFARLIVQRRELPWTA